VYMSGENAVCFTINKILSADDQKFLLINFEEKNQKDFTCKF
jgi:hypothetical protein